MPMVSLIVPVYNEHATIAHSLRTILAAADSGMRVADTRRFAEQPQVRPIEGDRLELIAVDDGSGDASAEEIRRAAASDNRIRLLSFTRNFGKEAAIQAGLVHSRGDAVIVLDCDLQHPPNLIPHMVRLWREGWLVVDAVKQQRGNESLAARLYANAFYALFQRLAGLDLRGHSDFKLLDRTVVDAYLAFPERGRFFRGLIHWSCYPSAQIAFSVPDRAGGGGSQWSRIRLLRYAIDNITSFSSMPLRIVSLLGLFTLGVGGIIGAISLIQKFNGQAIGGFTTVILLLVLIGGAILSALGIIGHYLARLYDEVKARPGCVIKPLNREQP
ncbi:MAG: glycosyltransferase family 2 protein [Herminiimonas sp.]|nr:glycosyltransferase family 2 protein [Herminiimonas sp.]